MSIGQLLWPWTKIGDNNFLILWITWGVVVEFILLTSDLRDQCLIHWATESNLGGESDSDYLINELISLFIIYLHSYEISLYGFINPIDSMKHLYNSLNYEQQWTQYTTSPGCIQPIKPYLKWPQREQNPQIGDRDLWYKYNVSTRLCIILLKWVIQ